MTNAKFDEEIRKEAKRKGKASFHTWLTANYFGQDPEEYARRSEQRYREKVLAYSDYVRYDDVVHADHTEIINAGGATLAEPTLTIENIKQLFIEEREHTQTAVQESAKELAVQFQSFIEDNFNPTMARIDQRFDDLDDRVDRLTGDVAELRLDVRHVKQALRTRGLSSAA